MIFLKNKFHKIFIKQIKLNEPKNAVVVENYGVFLGKPNLKNCLEKPRVNFFQTNIFIQKQIL